MLFHQINGILFILLMPGGVLSKENGNTLVSELLQRCLSPQICQNVLLKVVTIGFKQDETQTVCVKPLITKVERAWSWDWPLVVDIFFHYIWTLQRKSQEFALIPFKGLLKTLGAFYIPHAEYFEWFHFFYFVLHSPCDFNKSNPWFPCIAKLDLMLKVGKTNTQISLKKRERNKHKLSTGDMKYSNISRNPCS